jgi:transcriptional regulator with XRE-family HTH domain
MTTSQANLLKNRRTMLGLSLREVAFRLKVSHQYYYKLEKGICSITPKIAKGLIIVLGLKTNDILNAINADFLGEMNKGVSNDE